MHEIDCEFEKKASLTGFLAALAAGEAVVEGISHMGRVHGPNLLRTGIELGSKGEKMNPYKETFARNLLGNRQLSPYEAGQAIGSRMQNMPPDQQERFLNKVVGMGSARKDRLVAEKEKVPAVLNALEGYQVGKDQSAPGLNNFLLKGSKPIDKNTKVQTAISNTLSMPGALLDFRAAARPIVRAAETKPKVQQYTQKIAPDNTKRKKIYDITRNYID